MPEIIGRVWTDSPDDVPALQAEIAQVPALSDGPLDDQFEAEFLSYYSRANDERTARAWPQQVSQLLAAPSNPDFDIPSGWP